MKRNNKIAVILFLLIFAAAIYAIDTETQKIMPFVSNDSECIKCHIDQNIQVKIERPSKADDAFCMKCHNNMKAHHPVGIRMKGTIPDGLELTTKNKIACFSCHNLEHKRFDDAPWKAESLYDSMFKKQNKYKTYYLIEKNNEGQLCSKCH